ncbi:MAG TPA: hypothetical protein VFI12_02610, partial [Thermomicrobiales bacterium]|nr:hypothetical protein [Thermomicrobiales bacterium]
RIVSQATGEDRLNLETDRPELDHQDWAERVLGIHRARPAFTDPVIRGLADRFPGMRPFSNGDLFEGIVTAIVGQSVSVQAAAVTERKLAELFAEPITVGGRSYWPSPTRHQLANSEPEIVRRSGVTQRRADAIVRIARMMTENQSLLSSVDRCDEQELIQSLVNLPQVGRWTAESVLLWGLGVDDAYPIRDVALLRAARLGYDQPEMTHGDMDHLSDDWRPGRSWAARLLWLNLFGPAPLSRAPD